MPNDTIDRAIRRGTGAEEGVTYDELPTRATGRRRRHHVDSMTDNRNRTVAEIRISSRKTAAIWVPRAQSATSSRRKAISSWTSFQIWEELFELVTSRGR